MHNEALWADYIARAGARLKALQVLLQEKSWADVVREAQEIVELCLKSLARASGIDAPRIHDVSPVLDEHRDRLPPSVLPELEGLIRASRQLRRDRELAFYGSEDLTPSEFYTEEDAATAARSAAYVHATVARALADRV